MFAQIACLSSRRESSDIRKVRCALLRSGASKKVWRSQQCSRWACQSRLSFHRCL